MTLLYLWFVSFRMKTSLPILFLLLSCCLIVTSAGIARHSRHTSVCKRVCRIFCLQLRMSNMSEGVRTYLRGSMWQKEKRGRKIIYLIVSVWMFVFFFNSDKFFHLRYLQNINCHVVLPLGTTTVTDLLILRSSFLLLTHLSRTDIFRYFFNQ